MNENSVQTCPICEKTVEMVRSWVRCPRYGDLVCEKCCSQCRFRKWLGSICRCTYGKFGDKA